MIDIKQITFKFLIAICAFTVGLVFTLVRIAKFERNVSGVEPIEIKTEILVPQIPEAAADSKIYPVDFCELIRNAEKYDEKIVRIKAIFWQGIDASALTDENCEEFIRPRCDSENIPCEKIWERVDFGETKVDIIGRFKADFTPEIESANQGRGKYLEILELKSAKPLKAGKIR